MKFYFTLFLILSIIFINSESKRVRSRVNKSHRTNVSSKGKSFFLKGLAKSLYGNVDITTCLSNVEWLSDKKSKKPEHEFFTDVFVDNKAEFEKIKGLLKNDIDIVCLQKPLVTALKHQFVKMSYTKKKGKKANKAEKTKKKDEVEIKDKTKESGKDFTNLGKTLAKVIEDASTKTSKGIFDPVSSIANADTAATKFTGKDIKTLTGQTDRITTTVFGYVQNTMEPMRPKMVKFLRSLFQASVNTFNTCVTTLVNGDAAKLDRISNISQKVNDQVKYPLGWIGNLTNLTCSHLCFKKCIIRLEKAINEKNEDKQWELFGRFYGKWLKC